MSSTRTPFIHLRLHTAYSLCEGAVKVEKIPGICIEKNMPAIAITDTNNMFGVLEFSMKCSEKGIQPIVGCQILCKYMDIVSPIVLIAQNERGYKNLLKLMTCFYVKNEYKEGEDIKYITLQNLISHNDGIIALSGGYNGPSGKLFLDGHREKAINFIEDMYSIFNDRFYIEISRHFLDEEIKTESFFIEQAMNKNIPLVATNDVYFVDRKMHVSQDILMCIGDGTYASEKNRRHTSEESYLKSTEEMYELFSDIIEAVENTYIIARRCSYMPEPHTPLLPKYEDDSRESEENILDFQARKGLKKRIDEEVLKYRENQNKDYKDIEKEYFDRLEYEMSVIKNMGFCGYFLIVSDFVRWSKSNDVPVGPGRGSGAGSIVGWSLNITNLDPIRYHLIFERFLNPERVSMPDFDIDFCQEKRENTIEYVKSKYGSEKVAHIIALGKLQARAVIRDVGRVIQMPYGKVDKICKLIPQNPSHPVDLEQALEIEPMLSQMMKEDESVNFLITTGLELEGLYRHASIHAAGIVIGHRDIDELVPLYSDDETSIGITQFNMKFVEKAGLVKFDFLGLKTLTIIKQACDLIKKYHNIELDIDKIDIEDKKTFELLCNVDVIGIFQLESGGMRDVIQKLQPDNLEDIIALISLYRPGPMENIPLYIARKHGEEKVEYLHETLEPVLKNTYGIMIYQEQVMKIAQVMGGYTLAASDLLRRAMGKKIKEEMIKHRSIFSNGAQERGIPKNIAEKVFDLMEKFASYGFNRSHAAAYALVSYQTAYLKANHRREFYIATMNLDIGNTEKIAMYVQDIRSSGLKILPPDINKSEGSFSAGDNNDEIRYALGALKGSSVYTGNEIVAEREKNGPFKDVFDFFKRLDRKILNKRQVESLILSGAFDSLHPNRRQLFESVESLILDKIDSTQIKNKQMSLFNNDKNHNNVDLKNVHEWGVIEKLEKERSIIGFYLSDHPMDVYADFLKSYNITRSKDFLEVKSDVKIAGILLSKKERLSKNAQKYCFLVISDKDNSFEVTIFPDLYSKISQDLNIGTAYIMDANIKVELGNLKILATSFQSIDSIIQHQKVYILLENNADIDQLYNIIDSMEDGNNQISFIIYKTSSKKVEIETTYKKNLSIENRRKLSNIPGISFYK